MGFAAGVVDGMNWEGGGGRLGGQGEGDESCNCLFF